MMQKPNYAELPRPDASALPLSWGAWGSEDQLGTLNNITPTTVAAAAGLVRRGVRFNLNLPLDMPLGVIPDGAHRHRRGPKRKLIKESMFGGSMLICDECVEIYPQASSQWDGLTHVGDPRHGYYNAVQDAQVTHGKGSRNGMEHFASFGIAARGVLVDLDRAFAGSGRPWAAMGAPACTADELDALLAAQGTPLRAGDILMVRTGWLSAFRAADTPARERLFRQGDYSGIAGDAAMWGYLWDHSVAAIVSDNVTVEVWPPKPDGPSLHLGIARMGFVLGELFDLDDLAADSAQGGGHECFFVSSPLNMQGGTGSTANAMALR